MATLAPSAALADTDLTIGGTAVVNRTEGSGTTLRSTPSYDAEVLLTVPAGTTVNVNDGPVSGGGSLWYAVTVSGEDGYLPAIFLTSGQSAAPADTDPASTDEAEAATEEPAVSAASTDTDVPADSDTSLEAAAVAGYSTVTGTNGDGVRCRSAASYSASTITVLAEGASVALRGPVQGEWQPVVCAGTNGFAHASVIGGSGADPVAAPEAPAANAGDGTVTGYTTVTGTNGEGLRCRSAAGYSASTITVIPEGTSVGTRGGAQGEWQPVVCAGMNGFAHVSFLGAGGGTAAPTAPAPQAPAAAPTATAAPVQSAPPASSGFATGSNAQVSSSLNLRYGPNYSSGVAAVAEGGTVVLITGAAQNGFYPIDWDGLSGFMHGDYLVATTAALSERGGSAPEAPAAPAAPEAPSSGSGGSISGFALQYQGYPYVWATSGPASFDCSGFTYWVIKNTVGIDIGRGLFTQVAAGTPVSQGNLQPGDLVFFQNTYTWGLSHAGVYIGNGQFIHAENETTGVKISDINSTYYSSRWYGAVRF